MTAGEMQAVQKPVAWLLNPPADHKNWYLKFLYQKFFRGTSASFFSPHSVFPLQSLKA